MCCGAGGGAWAAIRRVRAKASYRLTTKKKCRTARKKGSSGVLDGSILMARLLEESCCQQGGCVAMDGHPDFPMAMSEAEVEAVVREVTDEEVAHYEEYGWVSRLLAPSSVHVLSGCATQVMMRGLVEPAFAAEMLRAVNAAGEFDGHPARSGIEPFRSFMFSKRMSGNAAKLVNRKRLKGVDVPMRWRQVRSSKP